MANGGVIAPVGLNMVALAAQRHAVPFVVVAGSHKVIVLDLFAMHILIYRGSPHISRKSSFSIISA